MRCYLVSVPAISSPTKGQRPLGSGSSAFPAHCPRARQLGPSHLDAILTTSVPTVLTQGSLRKKAWVWDPDHKLLSSSLT